MFRVPHVLLLSLSAALAWSLPAYAAEDGLAPGREAGGGVTVTIDGLGYGHGRGMSQYGALGRANAGHGYRRIVNFYYPGTDWGSSAGRVRVLVTADTSRDVVVLDRAGLTVRALESGRTWQPGVAADRWRITPAADGRSVVSYRTDSWHEWRSFRGDAEFAAAGQPLALVTPAGQVAYRGALRSATTSSTADAALERDTVNVVLLDAYLKGVVPREVPALWPDAAVRAQSVAARTYAAFERADAPAGRHFDVWDTTQSQVYGGFSAEHPDSNAAVDATAGEVLTFGGEPAFTQFSASNGGWTVRGQVHGEDVPYLPARQDRKDHYDPDGGGEGWTVTRSGADVTKHWPGMGMLESVEVTSRDGNGAFGGRVLRIRVSGSEFSRTVSGDVFRSYLGLRSTLFDPTTG